MWILNDFETNYLVYATCDSDFDEEKNLYEVLNHLSLSDDDSEENLYRLHDHDKSRGGIWNIGL